MRQCVATNRALCSRVQPHNVLEAQVLAQPRLDGREVERGLSCQHRRRALVNVCEGEFDGARLVVVPFQMIDVERDARPWYLEAH